MPIVVCTALAWFGGFILGFNFLDSQTSVIDPQGSYYISEETCTATSHNPCELKYIKAYSVK